MMYVRRAIALPFVLLWMLAIAVARGCGALLERLETRPMVDLESDLDDLVADLVVVSLADEVGESMRGLADDVLGPGVVIVLRAQDDVFFDQVRKLAGTAAMALEEAEQYAQDIHDPVLRARALRFLDNAF